EEVEGGVGAAGQQERSSFYLVVDRQSKTLTLRVGDRIVREAPLTVGAPRTLDAASGERIVEPPLSGAFTVREKLESPAWKAPESAYLAAGQRVPPPLLEIPGGLRPPVLVPPPP